MVRIYLRILLYLILVSLAAGLCVLCYLISLSYGALLSLGVLTILIYRIIAFFKDILHDFNNFVQAMHYRDFSQHFSIKRAPRHLKFFRKGFNKIANGYKQISQEKELQYQYLQNVLELVDTAIMAFEPASGDIIWINAQMKHLLNVPGIKNLKRVQRQLPVLYEALIKVHPGAQNIIKLDILNKSHKLLLTSNNFITAGKQMKLIAMQNVEEALDVTETEAWHKLLRVLTHEIMNSIAPISSLANTLQERLSQMDSRKPLSSSDFKDFSEGMQTIRSRSDGLMRFSTSYRNLNKIGPIHRSHFLVRDLFESIAQLMQPSLANKNIDLDVILKNPHLKISADRQLLEQVLINLTLNAIDAVKASKEKLITIAAELKEDQIHIKVKDNGKGMSEQIMERIFIPFFTTKQTGSGIGLSLCKQIMLLHKGNIQVQSTPNQGTSFNLQLPMLEIS